MLLVLPRAKLHVAVFRCDDVNLLAEFDSCAVDADVPRFHEHGVATEALELRAQEVLDVARLDTALERLDEVGAMVATHGDQRFRFAAL